GYVDPLNTAGDSRTVAGRERFLALQPVDERGLSNVRHPNHHEPLFEELALDQGHHFPDYELPRVAVHEARLYDVRALRGEVLPPQLCDLRIGEVALVENDDPLLVVKELLGFV